jgi:hypothetical protein
VARRRQAEQVPVEAVGGLPPELAIGPCMEVWADRGSAVSPQPWFRALRAWQDAVDEWAWRSGWANDRRPASNARNLGRTRRPWSRSFLLAAGYRDLVDYFEGQTDKRPADAPQSGHRVVVPPFSCSGHAFGDGSERHGWQDVSL